MIGIIDDGIIWNGSWITDWYATMSERRVIVFPVPDGISNKQCPFASYLQSIRRVLEYWKTNQLSVSSLSYMHIVQDIYNRREI